MGDTGAASGSGAPWSPLGTGTVVGYCTNVHPIGTWDDLRTVLRRCASAVAGAVTGNAAPFGVGLWLPAVVAAEMLREDCPWIESLRELLADAGLASYTLNGFPLGDFHDGVVKHAVYRPDWAHEGGTRFTETVRLAWILAKLLPAGAEGSISTLPIGWRGLVRSDADLDLAARWLLDAAESLRAIEEERGTLIHLDIEPEPGCTLDLAGDVVAFFTSRLFALGGEWVSRYLRVCHDVCHSAVMFEDQREVLSRYADHGIRVGKVQVSAALQADLPAAGRGGDRRSAVIEQLRRFAEPRYLHQTSVGGPGEVVLYEDLPSALTAFERDGRAAVVRTHFHVPVYLDRIGALRTTSDQIGAAVRAARELHGTHHFEVETYAWGVLPPELRVEPLAEGIAREMAWFAELCRREGLS